MTSVHTYLHINGGRCGIKVLFSTCKYIILLYCASNFQSRAGEKESARERELLNEVTRNHCKSQLYRNHNTHTLALFTGYLITLAFRVGGQALNLLYRASDYKYDLLGFCMQRGETNGTVMTKQAVNGKVRVLQSERVPQTDGDRQSESGRATKGHPTAAVATTTNSGGVLLILGINDTHANKHTTYHHMNFGLFECTFCYSPISFN